MLRRFISLFLIAIILITGMATPSFANGYNENSGFKEWEETHLVEPFKEWIIEFSQELERDSVNNNNIYVKNHLGQIQDTDAYMGNDRKTIIVEPPRDGYSSEYDYTLYIDNIYSIDGRLLEENIQMKFFVDDGESREIIEYQEDIVELEDLTIYDKGYYQEIIMSIEEFEEQNLQESSIIIIKPTAEDIYGYAGRIVSYREEGNNIIIEVEEPSLEEVSANIDIKGQQNISVEQMIDIDIREGIEARQYRRYDSETRSYRDGVEYIFGSKGKDIAEVGVEYGNFIIKGSIRVENPKIDFDINTSFKGIERFYLAYKADIVSKLQIEYKDSFSKDLDESITLFKYPVPLGTTGFIADFKLDVYAEGDVRASGKIEAEVSQTTGVTLGARLSKEKEMEWVKNTTKNTPEFTSSLETEFKANAEVGISPSIGLSFLRIISTELEGKIGPYIKMDGKAEGGSNISDGYFKGKLYAEVGVAFSSTIYLDGVLGLLGEEHSLGKTSIKIKDYTIKYGGEVATPTFTKSTFSAGWGVLGIKDDGSLLYAERGENIPKQLSNIRNAIEVSVIAGDFGYEYYYVLDNNNSLWNFDSYEGYDPSTPQKIKDNIIHISGRSAIDTNNDLWVYEYGTGLKKVMSGVADVTSNALYNTYEDKKLGFALKMDGTVWSLESNSKIMDGVVAIDSNWSNGTVLYALKDDGSLWVFGESPFNHGNAGITHEEIWDFDWGPEIVTLHYDFDTPYNFEQDVASMSIGTFGLIAKKTNNTMWLWKGKTKKQIDLGNDVVHFSCADGYSRGNDYMVFMKSNGSVWKYNEEYQMTEVMDGIRLPEF